MPRFLPLGRNLPHFRSRLNSLKIDLFSIGTMDSKVWKEFLNAESKDESKREANLVILGMVFENSC